MKKKVLLSLIFISALYLMAQTNIRAASVARGKIIYAKVCLACHMADGNGVPHLNPPLNVAAYIRNKKQMITIVLKGMKDRIEIDGDKYSNNMAPHTDLTSQQIADVLTYVRSSFGNKASSVTLVEVNAVRATIK